MRLIDADLFMQNVRNELNCDERCCECVHDNLCEIYKMTLKQPTAFDLESAIEQLERHKEEITNRKERDILNIVAKTNAKAAVEKDIEILKSAANVTNGKNGG